MHPVCIIPLSISVCAFLINRRTSEETVGVMTLTLAGLLAVVALILAPWQVQMLGALVLLFDRCYGLKIRG
ncbi:hypothetical protein NG796_16325 [Laspinema sp. A4]|uniref:hypothetical protein n=1 Tax=Laspinema sp. D2d TaxID=2953686 RepID=UPI0021BA6E22|nr:hypothetical protein [Laspinema sp. D2d]MCT7984837.1 hypothetical protein [Laspinema sp. D2d]